MSNNTVTTSHKRITSHAKGVPSDFGKNLRRAREEAGLTQLELSEKTKGRGPKIVSVSKNTVYNIEAGNTKASLPVKRALTHVITEELKRPYPWHPLGGLGGDLNKQSIGELVKESYLLNRLDHKLAESFKLRVLRSEDFVEAYVDRMSAVDIQTIAEVEQHLKRQEKLVQAFGIRCYENPKIKPKFVARGIGIGLLQVILILEKKGFSALVDFLEEHRFDKSSGAQQYARELKMAFDRARKDLV